MSPEELDLAIEELLENRPNEEKPFHRRRNKKKDMMKEARRGDFEVPEKVVYDLVGDDLYRSVHSVRLTVDTGYQYVGEVYGGYEMVKHIAKKYGYHPDDIELESIETFNFRTGGFDINAERLIYAKYYKLNAYFYDEYDKYLYTRDQSWEIRDKKLLREIKQGKYLYEEIEGYIKEWFGEELTDKAFNRSKIRDLNINYGKLFDYDKEGRYADYKNAMDERELSRWYDKTERIEKGDKNGSHKRLINHLNTNARKGKDLLAQSDKLVENYESEFYKVMYEWEY